MNCTASEEEDLECTSSLALLGALSRCALEFRIISKSSSAKIVPTFIDSAIQSDERIQAPAAKKKVIETTVSTIYIKKVCTVWFTAYIQELAYTS
jgi:hypothetical protein